MRAQYFDYNVIRIMQFNYHDSCVQSPKAACILSKLEKRKQQLTQLVKDTPHPLLCQLQEKVNELAELQQQQTRHQIEQQDAVGKMQAQEQKVRSKEQQLMQQVFKSQGLEHCLQEHNGKYMGEWKRRFGFGEGSEKYLRVMVAEAEVEIGEEVVRKHVCCFARHQECKSGDVVGWICGRKLVNKLYGSILGKFKNTPQYDGWMKYLRALKALEQRQPSPHDQSPPLPTILNLRKKLHLSQASITKLKQEIQNDKQNIKHEQLHIQNINSTLHSIKQKIKELMPYQEEYARKNPQRLLRGYEQQLREVNEAMRYFTTKVKDSWQDGKDSGVKTIQRRKQTDVLGTTMFCSPRSYSSLKRSTSKKRIWK